MICISAEASTEAKNAGATIVTKENVGNGRVSFSYVNAKGCSADTKLLTMTFQPVHGVVGETTLTPGGKDLVNTSLEDITINYSPKTLLMPYGPGGEAAGGHYWDEGKVTQEATCTEDGIKTYTCSGCSETKTESIPALGHDLIDHEAKEATCTEAGWYAYQTCSRCDYNTIRYISALGHTIVTDPAAAATCTETGLTEGSHCSVCGEVLTEQTIIPALGHQAVTDPAVEPTCTENGLTEGSHCSLCGLIFTAQEEIPAIGHDFSVYVSNDDATCTEDGTETLCCLRCGEKGTETRTIEGSALGHEEVWDDEMAPTCTDEGVTAGSHCARCGEIFTPQESIPAYGHSYTWEYNNDATCTEDGTEIEICSMCGDILETRAAEGTAYFVNGMNLSLYEDGKIGFNYYVEVKAEEAGQLIIQLRAGDTEIYSGALTEYSGAALTGSESGICSYKVTCFLKATEMSQGVELTIGLEGKNTHTTAYSVSDYVRELLEMDTASEEDKAIAKAMLNYGAAAQEYFQKDTDNLANYVLTEEEQTLQEISDTDLEQYRKSDFSATETTPVDGITYYGSSLLLKSDITIRHYFAIPDGNIEDYTFTVDGREITPVQKNGLYYIDITGVTQSQLKDFYKVTVTDTTDSSKSSSLSYCAMSYLADAVGKTTNTNLQNLLKAMYRYGNVIKLTVR